jgi:hypothetical protein
MEGRKTIGGESYVYGPAELPPPTQFALTFNIDKKLYRYFPAKEKKIWAGRFK